MSSLSDLNEWAARNAVTPTALMELRAVFAAWDAAPIISDPACSEARVQSLVRLEAADAGVWLTRNNVGALRDDRGRFIRFGLANESKAQNTVIKSADLIGFRQRVIVASDVGTVIAQFTSRECKRADWKPNPNDSHEEAQRRWRDFVNTNGGDAAIVSGPGSFIINVKR